MASWTRQYRAVSGNAFLVAFGSPFSLILMVSVLLLQEVLACLPFFSFGEQLRLIRDQSLAMCLIGGCLAAALGAIQILVNDLRHGSAPVMMSRPLGRFCFVAGKWSGLIGSILVIHATVSIGCLWLTRIAGGEHGLNAGALWLYTGSIAAALLAAGLRHYLTGGRFVRQANLAVPAFFLIAFIVDVLVVDRLGHSPGATVHWGTAQACLMVFMALVVYSSLVTLMAIILRPGLLLGASTILFFGGLLSDYFMHSILGQGLLATFSLTLIPSWQLFWINDLLAEGLCLPSGQVAACGLHSLGYALMCLICASLVFRNRELEDTA